MSKTKDFVVEQIKERLLGFENSAREELTGQVLKVADGIAVLSGLSTAMMSEVVHLGSEKTAGVILNLEEDQVGVIILGDTAKVKEGDEAIATGRLLDMPVGEAMIGRVVDALGRPMDGHGVVKISQTYPLEKIAPGVIARQSVRQPLQTGIKAIDAMIPIGRGQRELIIGDRQIGKTAIAIDTIINQKGQNVKCIYVAIGQKESKVAALVTKLTEAGAMDYTTIVLAGASDPAALLYIAPYAGCALAEYFLDKGEDVLIVYDDLTKHANSYREISLLLRRPPGREAYPGDVFYLHSRLLERACKLSPEAGGGSLTALPIVETQAGDVSAYIPTNIISITDGQIYLEPDLFYQGNRPAINAGLSVSRVGSAAQTKAMKKVAGRLRIEAAQFRELSAFTQLGSDVDDSTKQKIERGRRLNEVFKQGQYHPWPMAEQVLIFFALTNGYLDSVPLEKITEFGDGLTDYTRAVGNQLLAAIVETGELGEAAEKKLGELILDYQKTVDYLIQTPV